MICSDREALQIAEARCAELEAKLDVKHSILVRVADDKRALESRVRELEAENVRAAWILGRIVAISLPLALGEEFVRDERDQHAAISAILESKAIANSWWMRCRELETRLAALTEAAREFLATWSTFRTNGPETYDAVDKLRAALEVKTR